ncbi:hypothetical protein GDO78_000904 [Eleutherodactylus coqui]|uniref:Proline rich 11 n=3 Tax=Eleutherodactylus coqui TaxID=57060 RepID=A0A8J6FQH1_ELECQ|nr:hypothetical protein GDO78_000904 [Eleutherodactylus coqui]KAG9492654.1 hypothetical protein GDO78_000904 [Eleutherodactylus coqui]
MAKFLQARRRPGQQKKRKPCTVRKTRTISCNSEGLMAQTDTKLPWYFTLAHSLWFLPRLRNLASSMVGAFLSLCLCIHSSAKKQISLVKNSIGPPFVYHLEQRRLKRRLHKLEVEFLKLQQALQTKDTNSSLSGSVSCCSYQQARTLPPITECKVEGVPSLPPPPPPPPLPPPLPPPPSFPLEKRLPLLKNVATTQPPKAPLVKQGGSIQITLNDLLTVKLRKTKDNMYKQKVINRSQTIPPITVSQLQSVKLKRACNMPPERLTNILTEKLNSPLNLKQRLKKVSRERSPGRTPLYDRENKANGTALTPLMTKTLRQKFQLAHRKSPSPLRRSPVNHVRYQCTV